MQYVSALVAYDGSAYHGFQYQSNAPSIQCELEAALDRVTERLGRVSAAGRTDAGVHASGQVIAVQVQWRHSLSALQRAWNVSLPEAITVRRLQIAPEEFHPRYSAVSRTYRYTVWQGGSDGEVGSPRRSPLTDRFALYEVRPLDLAAMQEAAACLIGSHDFATFGRSPKGEVTQRHVWAAEWQVVQEKLLSWEDYPSRRFVFTITANAFLRQMVRNLVGTLLAVGRGDWAVGDVKNALASCDRSRSAPPAPPHGLVLEKVTYPAGLDTLIHGK